jgi:hypothetical protein
VPALAKCLFGSVDSSFVLPMDPFDHQLFFLITARRQGNPFYEMPFVIRERQMTESDA